MTPLGTFTDEELAAVGSDGNAAARLAGPRVLADLDDGALTVALSTALRSLVARGLAEVAGDGGDELTVGGALARVVALRRAPRRVVLTERLAGPPLEAVLYVHDGAFLHETVLDPGYHDFVELDAPAALDRLLEDVTPEASPGALTRVRVLEHAGDGSVAERSLLVENGPGGVQLLDERDAQPGAEPVPADSGALRATLRALLG